MKLKTLLKRAISIMAVAAVVITGCNKDIKNDIDNLKQRVTTLEQAIASLKQQSDAGKLITSVTPLSGNTGYKITFSDNSSIDLFNGTNGANGGSGATPRIEVRVNNDGSVTLWVDTGTGLRDTGINIKGSQGSQGGQGQPGEQGASGITPTFKVDENDDNELTLWVSYDEGTTWDDLGVDLNKPPNANLLKAIIDNDAAGTVTFILNDADDTEFVFEKASTAVSFELAMVAKMLEFSAGGSGEVKFRVNPSNAFIPTGIVGVNDAMDKWQLDEIGTRASYVNPSTDFELVSILSDGTAEGQYIATIENTGNISGIHVMALVLNVNSAADPVLISSPTFLLTQETIAYAITPNLTGVTGSNTAVIVAEGETYSTVFTAGTGFQLPASITVTMGGNPLTEGVEYNYNSATGDFEISNVTGNLVITIVGVEIITVTAAIMTVTPFGTLTSTTFTAPFVTKADIDALVALNTGCSIVGWYTTDNPLGVEAVFPITAAATLYARLDGDGSASITAPFTIATAAELEALSARVDTENEDAGLYYKLIADIDLGGTNWVPIGYANSRPFSGHFDGGGFKIIELYINTVHDNTGLFGYVTNGSIQNLGVEIAAGGITGGNNTGGVVGQVNNTTVSNCYVTGGSVSGNFMVGGIVGWVMGSDVSNCYATCTVSGAHTVGGIAGVVLSGNIINCAAFNPSVGRISGGSMSTYFGRVAGGVSLAMIDGAVAYSGMMPMGGIAFPGTNTAYGWDGTSVNASTLKATYIGMGWLFDDSVPTPGPWVWDEAGFPRLSFGPAANPF